MHTIKPIDKEIILQGIEETQKIITVEDHNVSGGLGSTVAEVIVQYGKSVQFKVMGLLEFSKTYGTYGQVKEQNGLGKGRIEETICTMI